MNSITLEGLVGSGELWLDIMRIICGDTSGKSMVDLGCHKAPYTPLLGFSDRTYVDIQDRPLDHALEQQYFVHSDMVDYIKECNKIFDVAISSDSLEHLGFNTSVYLIHIMTQKSVKQIVFTPLGPLNHSYDPHPDSHKSWWWTGDFPEWGHIILPNFHEDLKCGAFFAYNCDEKEKQRIYNEIKSKYVENRID
jgi:hypothetical protein